MIFIACILWMIPSQACNAPFTADWPFIDEFSNDMGDIECGETVSGRTSGLLPDPDAPFDNYYHVYRLLVQGDDCQVDISACGEETGGFLLGNAIGVFDGDQQLIRNNVTECETGSDAFNELLGVSLSSTTCSAYYIRFGGPTVCAGGNYTVTLSCTGCTSCVLEEEPVDCSLCDGEDEGEEEESSESSESVDDAKAVSVQHDDGIFANMDDDDIVDDQVDNGKEVTLRVADKVWENIYGAIIVLMVCCGVFCFMFGKTNKRYV